MATTSPQGPPLIHVPPAANHVDPLETGQPLSARELVWRDSYFARCPACQNFHAFTDDTTFLQEARAAGCRLKLTLESRIPVGKLRGEEQWVFALKCQRCGCLMVVRKTCINAGQIKLFEQRAAPYLVDRGQGGLEGALSFRKQAPRPIFAWEACSVSAWIAEVSGETNMMVRAKIKREFVARGLMLPFPW